MVSKLSPIAEAVLSLRSSISPSTGIFTDSDTDEFTRLMQRWSDASVKTPSAILTPASEEDIVIIVEYAVKHSIPFVPKAGGHSPWSTIDSSGWIIDLTQCSGIKLDIDAQTATIQAGVLTKSFNQVVHKAGFCLQSAGAATVGHIPFVLGGGQSWMTGMYGMAIDQMISARVVTATRGLVTTSETENMDLFWAMKGAGQFFGLVSEITVRIFPVETEILSWSCIFLPSQIKAVGKAIEKVSSEDIIRSPGMVAIMSPPGQNEPMIMVNTKHFCSEEEARRVMEPLIDAKPIKQIKDFVDFAHLTDSADALNKSGGFKAQISCGMQKFNASNFEESLKQWEDLVDKYPGTSGSFFMFSWVSTEAMKKVPDDSTCWSHRDCGVWSMSFVSGIDEASGKAAAESAENFLAMCQEDQKEDERAFFPNHTRMHKLEQIYRGDDRRRRLKKLKRKWDPQGFFTRQFL